MTRAKRYGTKINLVVRSTGTGVETLQVEIPFHWPIQWLRWEMRIELGRQQWGFWLRKHICDTVKLERILGQNMYGWWGRGSIAPRPQARVPGRDLTGASPLTTDLMTLHHNYMAAWDVGHSGAALMWLSRHPNTKTCHHGFPWGKHEDNLWKTQLGVIALPWIGHMILIEWLSLLSFEPSSGKEQNPLCLMHMDFVRSTKYFRNWKAPYKGNY